VAIPDDQTSPGPDPFEGLVLDEDFVRGARQKEASARSRMLAERWKREPPVDPAWRPPPRRRRRFPWRGALVVVAAVAVVWLMLNAEAIYQWATS
jgi:hypothetical protein